MGFVLNSNWETMAFLVIYSILQGRNKVFDRSQLMSPDNLDAAIQFLKHLGHKEKPDAPEQTLQKTIQNLRDKGFIDFIGQGNYKLKIGRASCRERV